MDCEAFALNYTIVGDMCKYMAVDIHLVALGVPWNYNRVIQHGMIMDFRGVTRAWPFLFWDFTWA